MEQDWGAGLSFGKDDPIETLHRSSAFIESMTPTVEAKPVPQLPRRPLVILPKIPRPDKAVLNWWRSHDFMRVWIKTMVFVPAGIAAVIAIGNGLQWFGRTFPVLSGYLIFGGIFLVATAFIAALFSD